VQINHRPYLILLIVIFYFANAVSLLLAEDSWEKTYREKLSESGYTAEEIENAVFKESEKRKHSTTPIVKKPLTTLEKLTREHKKKLRL